MREVKDIKVFNIRGKELAPTNITIAKTLVARDKAKWIKENESLTLLYTKNDFKQMKKRVIREEHRVCYICGEIIPQDGVATVDHVYPKSKLGKDIRENLRCCCKKCNDDKGNMSIKQYYFHIKDNKKDYPHIDLERLKQVSISFNGLFGGKHA